MIDVSAAVFIFVIALAGVVLFLLGYRWGHRVGLGRRKDSTYPHILPFNSWADFVDRVAKPMMDDDKEDPMDLYYKASPYFICASMVFMDPREDETPLWVVPGDSTD